jgi:hypothetical protein
MQGRARIHIGPSPLGRRALYLLRRWVAAHIW